MKLHKKGLMVIISGPSGVGKSHIKKSLFQKKGHNFVYSVSMTTRPARCEEQDGVDYFFVEKSYFQKKITENYFLEYNKFVNHYYGTPYKEVKQKLKEGNEIFLEIDVEGALQIKKHKMSKNSVFIFIAPPSVNVLYKRLKKRNTESEEIIKERLKQAKYELSQAYLYDYIVINDEVEKAVDKIISIVVAEHSRVKNSISAYLSIFSEVFDKKN
ncbi:MAG: guanylate kinase [Vigna little leaf phytoplasma]|nr:guanylate kinase [Vigna little leaf phytoplasma]